ncbi:MAG: HAMP domain-containing sensor histidine kinase [Candidatus Paceibacterota bacterium]
MKKNKKELQEEILILKKKLEQQREMSKIIFHDLRSPFNSILGLLELLSESFDKNSNKDNETYAKAIYLSAKKYYLFLEECLEFYNANSKSISYNPERINIFYLMDSSSSIFKDRVTQKEIQFTMHPMLYSDIMVDKNMILSVFRNLISNAIKFTPKGGKINFSCHLLKKDQITFEIKDSGMGMTNELLSKLFKIGERVSRNDTENKAGCGLGLLIAKEFIEIHKGGIRVESTVGEGSTFFVSLPYHEF